MKESWKFASKHRPISGKACRTHRTHRDPVITELAADDLDLVRLPLTDPEEPRSLNGTVVGFTTTGSKEKVIDRPVCSFRKPFRQLRGRNIRVSRIGRCESQLLHLPRCSLSQIFLPVAEGDVPK